MSTAKRNRAKERRLAFNPSNSMIPLGCTRCPQLEECGGLRIEEPIFDCLGFCCRKGDECDKVCPNNVHFANRVREIGGFALDNVPRSNEPAAVDVPNVVPVIFRSLRLDEPLEEPFVCLPLYSMFDRKGWPRFESHEDLCDYYGLRYGTRILLTGTDRDRPLERWWSLGRSTREALIRSFSGNGIIVATTPNYSLFTDVPRWDDLHAIKRIADVHQEFIEQGLPTALHVNSRTERDFRRWSDFVASRSEIGLIAYEFTTGTRYASRRPQHVNWLRELADSVHRPLDIYIRGGSDVVPDLARSFRNVTYLDTNPFLKTVKRQKAEAFAERLVWSSSPTVIGEPLDGLLRHNIRESSRFLDSRLSSHESANAVNE